jgi:hypothetical protein
VIEQLLRPVVAWVMWTRRRFALTLFVLAVVAFVLFRAARFETAGHHSPLPRPAAAAPAAARPAGTAAVPVSATSLARAVAAAERFTAAWVSRRPGWAGNVRRYATSALAGAVTQGDHAFVPATAVTGAAAAIAVSAGSVTVSVPTDAGPALVTMVPAGPGWLASAVRMARTGN